MLKETNVNYCAPPILSQKFLLGGRRCVESSRERANIYLFMKPTSYLSFGCVALCMACVVAPYSTFGSGSYCACMPKPPPKEAKVGRVDRDRYDLGQKVYNGKTAAAQGDATSQRARLESLQSRLPANVAKKKDLTTLAGKLTEQQLDALDYFVKERYPNPR